MNAPTHVTPKPEPKAEAALRIKGVVFCMSVQFAGVQESIQIGRNADSITPARIEADGSAIQIDKGQRSDGLLIKWRKTQCVVPWANVRELQYGAP